MTAGEYQNSPRIVPRTLRLVPKNLPTDLAGMGPEKSNAPTKTCFLQKKKTWLPNVCYTCGPLCIKNTTWFPPFVLKKPYDGFSRGNLTTSFPPRSTTFSPRCGVPSVSFLGIHSR